MVKSSKLCNLQRGFPVAIALRLRNDQKNVKHKSNGNKQRSGQAKRSTLFPEGRGQGVGGRKRKRKRKGKKRKEVELNTCVGALEEGFGDMEVLIKEEEVCDFPGGDAA